MLLTHPKLILMALIAIFISSTIQAKEPDWSNYAALLNQYVSTSQHHSVQLNWIHYSQLKSDARWNKVVAQLETFSPDQLTNQQEQLAFYINAYNIMAIKTVVDNWPLESIKDVGNFIWPVWKRTAGKIGQTRTSLNEIEHEILRPMGEPRVHFAIVCASVSCPNLRNEPFTATNLNKQLDEQTAEFISNSKKGLYQDGNIIHVSQIFSWFEDDFSNEGGIKKFIARYRSISKEAVIQPDIPYNWLVNGG